MQRLINPSAEKVFVHNETSYTIKPLTRQQHEQIRYMWLELVANDVSRAEFTSAFKRNISIFKYRSQIDIDALEKIIVNSIVKIDHPGAADVPKYLQLLPSDDFWIIYNQITDWTGLDEDTENFSDSSPVQDTAVSVEGDVQKTAEQVEGLASDTEIVP